jgi:pyruvate formate lyase activating enzyme
LCLECIRAQPQAALEHADRVHASVREQLGQVPSVPRAQGGVPCPFCARACVIAEGDYGFCGLRTVRDGRLRHLAGDRKRGLLHWYRDPLPTNCVADFVCGGHKHRGCHNLAVFYGACTLNCLFCQNWTFRRMSPLSDRKLTAEELAEVATPKTHCICYFGGDPAAQMPHALVTSRILAKRGVAVCFETNGLANQRLLLAAARLARRTGGLIKFDLKSHDPVLHQVLTSSDNRGVLDNFRQAAGLLIEKGQPPQLIGATLLVPGYIDETEVGAIAAFIAGIDPRIPYRLLAFAPQFQMTDLRTTSRSLAEAAARAAREAGLESVQVGNRHLLTSY